MKKGSTTASKQSRSFSQRQLSIGLDLGDRSNCYCVLEETGRIVMEQKVATTPKALQAAFGPCRAAASRGRRGCIRRGSAAC